MFKIRNVKTLDALLVNASTIRRHVKRSCLDELDGWGRRRRIRLARNKPENGRG
jgi:hypothetical protein